jgi:hypothetical protein
VSTKEETPREPLVVEEDGFLRMRTGAEYRLLRAEVWFSPTTSELVVLGDPRDVEPEGCADDDPRTHNCDQRGCGQSHVLGRLFLWPPSVRAATLKEGPCKPS